MSRAGLRTCGACQWNLEGVNVNVQRDVHMYFHYI